MIYFVFAHRKKVIQYGRHRRYDTVPKLRTCEINISISFLTILGRRENETNPDECFDDCRLFHDFRPTLLYK